LTSEAGQRVDDLGPKFVSDNAAGVHPSVLRALEEASSGAETAYGYDRYSDRLQRLFRDHFGAEAEVYGVFNGTGANVVALQGMTQRWDSVVCSDVAHIGCDEGGAAERIGGIALRRLPSVDGKLDVAAALSLRREIGDEHRTQPRVLSLTQATEYGTCYSVEELATICEKAHAAGYTIHLDGARLANAAAALGASLRELTVDVGVDVLSFGGTKNGLMYGDCVVVINPASVAGLKYIRKSTTQLASKMRYIAVQLAALMVDGLWFENADRANRMARRLADRVEQIPGLTISRPVETNAVFVLPAPAVAEQLTARGLNHTWDGSTGELRWMTSFQTTEADVDQLGTVLTEAAAEATAARPGQGGMPGARSRSG
jgi:threonine aldolase